MKKLLFKILKIFLLVFILALLSITTILLWPKMQYGVETNDPNIIASPYFPSPLSKDYDFHTILFLKNSHKDKKSWASDQGYALISVDHLILSKPHPKDNLAKKDGNLRLSRIYFHHPKNVEIKNISVTHFNKKGEELEPVFNTHERRLSELQECLQKNKIKCMYQKPYKDKVLPNTIIEKIDIVFSYNDQEYHLKKEFLIKKKPYTNPILQLYDAIMSI